MPGGQKNTGRSSGKVDARRAIGVLADTLVSLANKFEDDLGSGSTLEEAARRLNLKVIKVDAIDRRGFDYAGKLVEAIGKNRDILQVAFTTEVGQDSILTDFGAASFFILRVDTVRPPELRALEAIRTDVAAAWKREQQATAETKTAELVDQLKEGKPLENIAIKLKATIRKSNPFDRTGQGLKMEIPGELVQALFSARNGVPVSTPETVPTLLRGFARLKQRARKRIKKVSTLSVSRSQRVSAATSEMGLRGHFGHGSG